MNLNVHVYSIWIDQNNMDISFDVIKTRIKDQYLQKWSADIYDCEKLSVYRSIKFDFCLENYFSYINKINILTKLWSGTLKLNVEVGRFSDIPQWYCLPHITAEIRLFPLEKIPNYQKKWLKIPPKKFYIFPKQWWHW